jgi:hypothetical protein
MSAALRVSQVITCCMQPRGQRHYLISLAGAAVQQLPGRAQRDMSGRSGPVDGLAGLGCCIVTVD